METKSGKELAKEINYQKIEKQRDFYAGWDCLTVVVGNTVHTIGMPLEINSEVNMDYVEARPLSMLRRVDSNHRPQGYEPCKLPSAPRRYIKT